MIERIKYFLSILILLTFNRVTPLGENGNLEWDYGRYGPDLWPYLEGKHSCNGNRQSPINIQVSETVFKKSLTSFRFFNYNTTLVYGIKQDNKGVTLVPENPITNISVYEKDLNQIYKFIQLHFHWGENIYQGSEHYINDKKFPLELHLVHQGVTDKSKYAVLGFVFKISKEDNQNMDIIVNGILDNYPMIALDLSKILPSLSLLDKYYRYEGSLTTPPCDEVVTWSFFNETINISEKQMNAFLNNTIKKNFRYPMPLNSRVVYRSFLIDSINSSTHKIYNLYIITIFILIIQFFI